MKYMKLQKNRTHRKILIFFNRMREILGDANLDPHGSIFLKLNIKINHVNFVNINLLPIK